jgi:HK97 family phage prohead protease
VNEKPKLDANMKLKRSFEILDLRAVNDEDKKVKRLDGHPAVYDTKTDIGGWYYEIIERGAFDECDFDDVLLCVNHETRKIPLARSRRNNAKSTMRIKPDNIGLYFEADLDTENNSEARQLYSSVERGDMQGMSFIFVVKEETWENLDKDMPTRRIKKIKKVYEVCAATFPYYESTDINARDKQALDNAKLALENARSQELGNSKALDIYKLKNKILGGI